MITEDYVNFEIAKLLKEKGFDEECIYVYRHDGSEDIWDADKEDIACQKPTLQMAMKWLRKVHNIHIAVIVAYRHLTRRYEAHIMKLKSIDNFILNQLVDFTSYEEACEAAIKYCLQNLI